jgi:hypothetical protein
VHVRQRQRSGHFNTPNDQKIKSSTPNATTPLIKIEDQEDSDDMSGGNRRDGGKVTTLINTFDDVEALTISTPPMINRSSQGRPRRNDPINRQDKDRQATNEG